MNPFFWTPAFKVYDKENIFPEFEILRYIIDLQKSIPYPL